MLLCGCYSLDQGDLKELSPITFNEVSSIIDVSLGETLVYDELQVTSELPVEYQWAYGKKKAGGKTEYDMESMEIISTDPHINYNFDKLGTYILRLRLDNGESVEYKYFTLNVNSGLDEGLLILNDRDAGKSALTFIKRRNAAETERDEREIWDDVFSTMNPGLELRNATSVFLSAFTSSGISYNHLAISTNDSDGTIYDLDPKTLKVMATTPMQKNFGTWCRDFSGSQTASSGAYTFILGGNGHVYRYDLFTPFLTERTDTYLAAGAVEGCKTIMYSTTSTYIKSLFFTDKLLCQPDNSGTTNMRPLPDGYSLVNVCMDRDANKVYTLMRRDSDPSEYLIQTTTGSLQAFKDVTSFRSASLTMDEESIFCTSLNSNDAYYSWNNRIYRWGYLSEPSQTPAIRLEDGEQICCLATNFMGTNGDSTAETLLYVATWDPSFAGELKGSLYVYDIATDSLVKVYRHICGRPSKLLYKYRIS